MPKKPATKKEATTQRGNTARVQLFIVEYLKDLNATQAAIRAGYSEKTAYSQGQRLLKNVEVSEAIIRAMHERTKRTKVDADWLLKRLADEAFADIADIYNDDGSLKPVKEWPMVWRTGLITGIETVAFNGDSGDVDEELEPQGHGGALKRAKKPDAVIHKVKLADRSKRLELIGRHVDVQAWKDRKVVSADEPLTLLFQQIAGQAIKPKES